MKKDYTISFARFIAMCFIIICHIMQKADFRTTLFGAQIEWANQFNVGVQMFLFLSGYLYGGRNIEIKSFYKKAIPKIIWDYYILIVIASVFFYIAPKTQIGIVSFVKMMTFCGGRVELGLGHLWFIKTILFCYLLLPIFASVINSDENEKIMPFCVKATILIILVQALLMLHFKGFSAPWTVCFLIGIIYKNLELKSHKTTVIFNILSVIICIAVLFLRLINIGILNGDLYETVCDYGHVFLGIVLVFIARFIYKYVISRITDNHRVLGWSDKYSYDVYLVHSIFIMSPYACSEFIENPVIAIIIAVLLTIIASMALRFISDFTKKVLIKE